MQDTGLPAKRDWTAELLDAGLIDDLSLRRAQRAATQGGARLYDVLLELGLIDEDRLMRFFANYFDFDYVEPGDFEAAPMPELTPRVDFLRRSSVAPVQVTSDGVTLAVSDPFDRQVAKTLSFQLELPVIQVLASRRTINEVLTRDYPDASDASDAGAVASDDLERLKSLANEGPVIKLVSDVITEAVELRASDIHIEAQETALVVRFRIDGTLHRHRTIGGDQQNAVVSRLKVLANLNISERRRPQDGRIRMAVRGRNIDLRMSTLPTQYGESIVLRVLDQSQLALDWPALGFDPAMVERIEHLTSRPHGIFLVCGPTGSGKTTTLYTAISNLDADNRKIFTVEDPVEYTLPDINQVQVRRDLDLTFATALRAILRQDPNVILVGEIRDEETAESAIRAALMGRMVLSTVHTNSALGAIDRLIDLGVPPFLLGATLRGVLSQRLVRRLCTCAQLCGVVHALPAGMQWPDGVETHEPVGCEKCGHSGYRGRVVLAELLEITPPLAQSITDGATAGGLADTAKAEGFVTLQEAGVHLAASGQTSVAEVFQMVDW